MNTNLAFRPNGPPSFESVGQPNLTQQISETRQKLTADKSLSPGSLQAVEYNEAHAEFFLAKKAEGGGEVIIAQSEAEENALLALLDRAPAEKDSRGHARFNLDDLRQIAHNVQLRAESEEPMTVSGLSDPDKFHDDKPYNTAGPALHASAGAVALNFETAGATAAGKRVADAEITERTSDSEARQTIASEAGEGTLRGAYLVAGIAAFLLLGGLIVLRRRARR